MTGSDFGAGIGQAYEFVFYGAIAMIVLAAIGCCSGGWWLGDRFDLPAVEVTW